MGSVWVLFFYAHTRPIYPTHFCKNVTYIKLYIGSILSVVCVFLFKVFREYVVINMELQDTSIVDIISYLSNIYLTFSLN